MEKGKPGLTERVPPHDLRAETALLGCLLLNSALTAVAQLRPDDFYRSSHGAIFRQISLLSEQSRDVDELTLGDALKAKGLLEQIGGTEYIHQLANAVPSAAHLESYVRIVKDMSLRRQVISASTASLREAEEGGSGEDAAAKAIARLEDARRGAENLEPIPIGEVLLDPDTAKDESWQIHDLIDLQEATQGICPGITLLSGGEGAGKTTFFMQIARNVARQGQRVYVWAKDEPIPSVSRVTWSGMAKTPVKKLYTDASESLGEVGKLPIVFDRKPFELPTILNTLKVEASRGTRWFVLDYLLLVETPGEKFRAEWERCVHAANRIKTAVESLNVYMLMIQSATEQEGDLPKPRNIFGGRQLRHAAESVWWLEGKHVGKQNDPVTLYIFKSKHGGPRSTELDFHGAQHYFSSWSGSH